MSALVLLVLPACANSGSSSTAATVGTIDITDAQLTKGADRYAFLAALLSQAPCGQKAEGESAESACNRFALSNLIQQQIVENYAAAHSVTVTVTDQEVTDTVANLDQQFGAGKVDQQLKDQSLTRVDLNELARSGLLFRKVQQKVVAEQLDTADLKKEYQKRILEFTSVQVDHILVKTQAEAEKVYQEVTQPGSTEADFLAIAKQVSIDPTAKQNSGSLGSAYASTYVPEFGVAAAALEPGEISAPVQSQFGWHVIRMNTKDVTPFAEAKTSLVQSEATTVFSEWLRGQVDAQGVDVNPTFGRYDVATLSVVPVKSTDPSATLSPGGTPAPVSSSP